MFGLSQCLINIKSASFVSYHGSLYKQSFYCFSTELHSWARSSVSTILIAFSLNSSKVCYTSTTGKIQKRAVKLLNQCQQQVILLKYRKNDTSINKNLSFKKQTNRNCTHSQANECSRAIEIFTDFPSLLIVHLNNSLRAGSLENISSTYIKSAKYLMKQ